MKGHIYEKAKKINSMALDSTGIAIIALAGGASVLIIFILVIASLIIGVKLIHKEYKNNNPIEKAGK